MGNDGPAIELLASACEALARRAQPHTIAARLTLADHGQVLQSLQGVLSGTHRGALVMAAALSGDLRAGGEHVAVQVDRAQGYALNALEATGRLLLAPGCAPAQRSLSAPSSRRLLVTSARSAARAAHDFGTLSGKRFGDGEALRWYGLLGEIVTSLGGACSHLAILLDTCAQRAGVCGNCAPGHLVSAMTELRRAQHHLHVITAVLRDAA